MKHIQILTRITGLALIAVAAYQAVHLGDWSWPRFGVVAFCTTVGVALYREDTVRTLADILTPLSPWDDDD